MYIHLSPTVYTLNTNRYLYSCDVDFFFLEHGCTLVVTDNGPPDCTNKKMKRVVVVSNRSRKKQTKRTRRCSF